MHVRLEAVRPLRFVDGHPVRAASAIVRLGEGWLIVQDDATHGCWWRDDLGTPVRLLPSVEDLDLFASQDGTKHLKPDLEAACEVPGGAVLLGSGSTPARMRAVLVRLEDDVPSIKVVDLAPLYSGVRQTLGIAAEHLNLEGACIVGDALRWFQRGRPAGGFATASVDVDLADLLEVLAGSRAADDVALTAVRRYDLGAADGVGLSITDAVSLGAGRVLVSLAAEDAPNAYDDGPVVASALAILDDDREPDVVVLPPIRGAVAKVEGLAILDWDDGGGRLLATVDADDRAVPSALLTLDVSGVSSRGSRAWSCDPGSRP